jgi:hypothetical protein
MRINLAAAIYGSITVGSVLAVESAQRETYAETVGGTLLALLIYWLAHSYAEYTSHRLEHGQALKPATLARTMRDEIAIMLGAGIPLLAVILSWAAGARLQSAVTLGVWMSLSTVVLLEVLVASRAELSARQLVPQLALGVLLGLGPVGLKLILH